MLAGIIKNLADCAKSNVEIASCYLGSLKEGSYCLYLIYRSKSADQTNQEKKKVRKIQEIETKTFEKKEAERIGPCHNFCD